MRSTWSVEMVYGWTTNPEFAFSATSPPPTAASKLKHKSKEGWLVVIQRGFQAEPSLLGRSSQQPCREKKRVGLILGFLAAGAWIRGQGVGEGGDELWWLLLPVTCLPQCLHLLHGQHGRSLTLCSHPHCHIGCIFTALRSLPRFSFH